MAGDLDLRRRSSGWGSKAGILILACFLLQTTAGAQVKEVRRVLILNEVGPAAPAITDADRGITEALVESPYKVELYSEYLETSLFANPADQQEFGRWYIEKYRNRGPDLIITVGPSPLRFMIAAHGRYFRDVPVVFSATTEDAAGHPKLDRYFTGQWEQMEPEKTLEAALRLQPGTKHVVVVSGASPYDEYEMNEIHERLRGYESKLDFTYLHDLTMAQILDKVGHLPDHTIVLFNVVLRDAAGTQYVSATESAPMVTHAANAPVFNLSDVDFGHGEIGGDLFSFTAEGKKAGEIALRILNGQRPQDIPITTETDTYEFDWRALQRWGFKEASLPPGSLIVNRQKTLWEQYRNYVLLAIFILLVQSVVIFGLLWQRRQKQRIQAELVNSFDRLHESEERFRLAMSNVSTGLYSLDLNGLVTLVNPAATLILGWTELELIGRSMHDAIHYKNPDGTSFSASDCAGLQTLREGIEVREHEDVFIRKDGSFFPVVYSASPLKRDGKVVGVVVGFRDDSQRREAERTMRENEERFRLVANTAPVMIWMSGSDKRDIYVNQRWLDFTGRPLEAELGSGWAEGVHPEDSQACVESYTRAFDRLQPFTIEYRLRRQDGEYCWIRDSGVPRFESDGSFAGYIGSAVDVTDRKLAEEALSRVRGKLLEAQDEERRRIARDLHDDVSQKLAMLSVGLQQLASISPESQPQLRNRIESLLRSASEMSDDVHALSHRLHTSKLELVGLVGTIRSFCRELSEQRSVEIDFTHSEVPNFLPSQISLSVYRILQEGLGNAVKHSGVRHFEVRLERIADQLQLTVRDSGVGFDPSLVKNDQGIGLIGIQERVNLVKGTLSIESKPGGGTRIQVRVPIAAQADAQQKSASA